MIPPNNQFAPLVSSNCITDNPPISAAAIIENYSNQLAQFNSNHMQIQFDSIFAELHRAADARKEQINVLSNFMTSLKMQKLLFKLNTEKLSVSYKNNKRLSPAFRLCNKHRSQF